MPRLSVFPGPASRSVRLRRTAPALPPRDAEPIDRELTPHPVPYADAGGGHRTTTA